ncbi:hypothetical protein HUU62_08650 [Rhodoferax sp. 4810]|uniref:Homeodomain-like domain-containing protein n=1 Tax=Thiospirillum jenense TaxID=1653858 RepID=A0A839HBG5_9GAMM|nr:hypothetical protein [Thiospirillum jenense]MBB1074478.1 hypothetical protein [Rhodoferax jenense]MBB1125540.1 hypothetical protein [Thiospirillum jenense]
MSLDGDVLIDVKQELLREGLDLAAVTRALSRIRHRWGGQRVYVLQIDRAARNEKIKQELKNGVPERIIAKRIGISVSTVRRKKSEWFD